MSVQNPSGFRPLSLQIKAEEAAVNLSAQAVAVPALASHVRPAMVLPERETRDLLAAAARQDVARGGFFAAGPAGIQVWSSPWNGPNGTHGDSQHIGSVDWSYDTPARHYATIYRVMVSSAGVALGETPEKILERVLSLTGLPVDGSRIQIPQAPARDPFRRRVV